MVQLIIAEKPSVGRDLARVLGVHGRADGYLTSPELWISWCIGHVAELCEPAAYDPAWKAWSRQTLPMLPAQFKLAPAQESADQWKVLRRLLNSRDVREVVNACDAGREGELIFRFAYELAGCKKPVRRLWLSSLTDQAVRAGFAALRPGREFDALADAARCRSEADWLVGLNATRALTLHGRQGGGRSDLLTVGRVQTPTLAMIVQRESEIEAFRPDKFWQVIAHFVADAGDYDGMLLHGKENRFDDPAHAQAVADAVVNQPGKVTHLERKENVEPPPLLFDLTSLQRLANARFGLTAAATLEAAQALYEKHKLVTYPRTDSNYLTTDMVPGLPATLSGLRTPPYDNFVQPLLAAPLNPGPRIICDSEVGDHHAIIPTGKTPNMAALATSERHVLDLVMRRFIAAFYPAAHFALTRVETQVLEHRFLSRGKERRVEGWQAVEPPPPAPKNKDGSPLQKLLPNLKVAEQVTTPAAKVHAGETKPPPRYSEAALLGAMERAGGALDDAALRRAMKDSGLGTPATRAAIIENLKRRSYIGVQDRVLTPTAHGRQLIASLKVDQLKSAQLTGEWEARLAKVARGDMTRPAFMVEVHDLTRRIVADIFASPPPIALAAAALRHPTRFASPPSRLPEAAPASRSASTAHDARGSAVSSADSLGLCPLCKTNVKAGAKAYHCESGRECNFVIFNTVAGRTIGPETVQNLLRGTGTETLSGFRSRTGRPFSAALTLDGNGRVVFQFDRSPSVHSADRPSQEPSQ